MLVGMTYDLKDDYLAQGFTPEQAAEFDSEETIAAIENALKDNGYEVARIGNIKSLVKALARGQRWDIVFNICEGVSGIAREAQVPALLEAYGVPYVFSSPEVLSLTMDKALTKRVVRDAGIPTPDFAVVGHEREIRSVNLPYPLFAKPLAEGTSKGIHAASHIKTPGELKSVCRSLLAQFAQPVLVETFLPGREFTVCLLGSGPETRVGAIGEIRIKSGGDQEAYTYRNKLDCFDDIVLYKGPQAKAIGKTAVAAWQALGCQDCGRIDIRLSETGVPNFLEVNPLAGLQPDYSELPILIESAGTTYKDLIGEILHNAKKRYGMTMPSAVKRQAEYA